MRTRIAVVGFGRMGVLHASILSTMADAELVAICERSSILRRYGARMLEHVRWVSGVDKLDELAPDAIWVTTPTLVHYDVVMSCCALRPAPSIFVEKPLATTLAQCIELCDLVEEVGALNMVGYSRRSVSTFRRAREMVLEGVLGEIHSFEAHALSSDGIGRDLTGRGGVLLDLGCHALDLLLWFFPALELLSSKLTRRQGNVEDEAVLTLADEAGVKGTLIASWCMDRYRLPEIEVCVFGAKGRLRATDDELELDVAGCGQERYFRHDLDDPVPFLVGGVEYYREDAAFLRATRDSRRAEPSFRDTLSVHKLIDRALGVGRLPLMRGGLTF